MECQNRINILNNAFWSKMLCNDIVCRIVSYQVKFIDVQVQETFLLSQEFVNLEKTKKWDKKIHSLPAFLKANCPWQRVSHSKCK